MRARDIARQVQATVRGYESHEWRAYRALRLRALADAPDAFETTLASAEARSDDDWREQLERGVRSSSELPLLAEVEGEAVGLSWGVMDRADAQLAHLLQMWVAPESRGRGTGALLLRHVAGWLRDAGRRWLMLSVTCGDSPARRLYERAGFECCGDPEPLRAGSSILSQPMRLALAGPRCAA